MSFRKGEEKKNKEKKKQTKKNKQTNKQTKKKTHNSGMFPCKNIFEPVSIMVAEKKV